MPLSEKTIQATINTLAAEWTLQQKTGTNRFRKPALEIGGQIMMGYRRSLVMTDDAAMLLADNYMDRSRTKTPPHIQKRHWKITRVRVPVIHHINPPLTTSQTSFKPLQKRARAVVLGENDQDISKRLYGTETLLKTLVSEWNLYSIVRPSSTNMRDRALVCLRHQMFLHDQRIGPLNLAGCFVEGFDNMDKDSHRTMGLAISLQGAVALPRRDTHVAIALRHRDYRRCPVSAVAYYLFDRFQVS